MRLKEIKPCMVIHCKNDEEKKMLLEEAERLGYRWYGSGEPATGINAYRGMTIHFDEPCDTCGYFNITSASVWKNGHFTDYEDEPGKIGSIIAWAEMPEPYEENYDE